MRKVSFSKLLLAMMLMLLLVLAACSGGSDDAEGDSGSDDTGSEEGTDDGEHDDSEEDSGSEDGIYSIEDFNSMKTNEGEPMDGGTLNFGLVTASVFEGTLNPNFYSGAPDAEIIDWFDESLLYYDENYMYTQDGPATFEVSEDGTTFTFTIRDNVNWHDGEPVTAEDWEFSYYVLADPEYPGNRFVYIRDVVGAQAYKDGETDTIEGIEVIDDKTLQVTFEEANPSKLANGLWTYAMPKHIFEDIPVAEMEESPEVRENPIGMGPFKVETVTPGESVTFSANEDYWQGEPNLDEIVLQVIAEETVAQALESGQVDLVDRFPADQYADVAESMTNVEFLGMIDLAYTYIGFKLGDWDSENGRVNMNLENSKVSDVELRRAMWHAVDNDTVGEQFYNGLRWKGTTLIPPSHPAFHNDEIEVPEYDPELANQILDEAGYEDVDGDGFRENPEGEELVLNFASMEGGDTAEPIANYYIQAWGEVGINVQLINGRLLEFNDFYDRVGQDGNDDPEIDIYQGAWSVGADVDPTGLYGPNELFNFPRYESEENDRLLAEGISPDAMDEEYRVEVYDEWQELMVEEIPVFPTLYRAELVGANERVVNWNILPGGEGYFDRHELGVTQDEPVLP